MLLTEWFSDDPTLRPWSLPQPLGSVLARLREGPGPDPALLCRIEGVVPQVGDPVHVSVDELPQGCAALVVAADAAAAVALVDDLRARRPDCEALVPELRLSPQEGSWMRMDFEGRDGTACHLSQWTRTGDGSLRVSLCEVNGLPDATRLRVASSLYEPWSPELNAGSGKDVAEVSLDKAGCVSVHTMGLDNRKEVVT